MNGYCAAERRRYEEMLASMKPKEEEGGWGRVKGKARNGGWLLYLSSLETAIIEEKLRLVLESLTFKFTRQPALLSLIPDRITESTLRVASTVQLHAAAEADQENGLRAGSTPEPGGQGKPEKAFYRDVYSDPQRAQDLRTTVESVLHVVRQPETHQALAQDTQGKPLRAAAMNEGKFDDYLRQMQSSGESASKEYTVTRHVCVAGVEPAKRPKYQLIASMLYLVDFRLRRVNRRTELFAGRQGGESRGQEAEAEYDAVLDAVLAGIRENYGDDEINHVLDLVQLKRGGHDSAGLEAVLREKQERQAQKGATHAEKAERARRRQRQGHGSSSKGRSGSRGPRGEGSAEGTKQSAQYAPVRGQGREDAEISALIQLLKEQERGAAGDSRGDAGLGVLKNFLAGRATQAMTGPEEAEFRALLASPKTKLGARAGKLAEERVLKARLEAERRGAGQSGV